MTGGVFYPHKGYNRHIHPRADKKAITFQAFMQLLNTYTTTRVTFMEIAFYDKADLLSS